MAPSAATDPLGQGTPALDQALHVLTRAETVLDIGRSTEDIFFYIANVTRHVDWAHTYLAVEPLATEAPKAGLRFRVQQKQDLRWDKLPFTTVAGRSGADYTTELEVVEVTPHTRLAWRGQVLGEPFVNEWGLFLTEVEVVLEPISERIATVRMRTRLDGSHQALVDWLESLRGRGWPPDVLNRQVDRSMHNLRTILEGRATPVRV